MAQTEKLAQQDNRSPAGPHAVTPRAVDRWPPLPDARAPLAPSPAPWSCAGGRPPLPSPPQLPPIPSPAAPPRSRRPARSAPAQCGLRGRRLHLSPCAAAAQAAACRRALALCGAARRLPPASGPLQQVRGRLQPAAGQGQRALTPQPTARLAESPTPTATSCSRRTAGGSGTRTDTPNSVIRQVFLSDIIIQKEHLHGGYSLRFFYTDHLGC